MYLKSNQEEKENNGSTTKVNEIKKLSRKALLIAQQSQNKYEKANPTSFKIKDE